MKVMLASLGGGALLLALGPAYREYHLRKAEHLLAYAAAKIRTGQDAGDDEVVRQATSLSQPNERLTRALAAYYVAREDPRALFMLHSLRVNGAASERERLQLADLALRWNQPAHAAPELAEALRDPDRLNHPQWGPLCARWMAGRGQLPQALAHLADLRRQGLASTELEEAEGHCLLSADPALHRNAAEAWQQGWRRLLRLAEDPQFASRPETVVFLTRELLRDQRLRTLVTPEEVLRLAEAATAGAARATLKSRLQAQLLCCSSGLRLLVRPEQKGELLSALEQAFTGRNPEEKLLLGRWLAGYGFHQEALAWAERWQSEGSTRGWLLVRWDSLSALNRWQEVEDDLNTPQAAAMAPPVLAAFRLRLAGQLGLGLAERAEREARLLRSMEAASPAALLQTVGYLEAAGEWKLAAAGHRKLASLPLHAATGLAGLARCLDAADAPLPEVITALQQLLKLEPGHLDARNDLVYLSLLEESAHPGQIAAARQLLLAEPGYLSVRTTAALAELRAGDAFAAERVYDGLEVEWSLLPPRSQLVRAMVASANGLHDLAHQLSQWIDRGRLRAIEIALAAEYLLW